MSIYCNIIPVSQRCAAALQCSPDNPSRSGESIIIPAHFHSVPDFLLYLLCWLLSLNTRSSHICIIHETIRLTRSYIVLLLDQNLPGSCCKMYSTFDDHIHFERDLLLLRFSNSYLFSSINHPDRTRP